MIVKSKLKFNNKKYGEADNKTFIALITGRNKTFKFNRKFINKKKNISYSTNTEWYSYEWNLGEGIYHHKEENNINDKFSRYFEINNGKLSELTEQEVIDYLKEESLVEKIINKLKGLIK